MITFTPSKIKKEFKFASIFFLIPLLCFPIMLPTAINVSPPLRIQHTIYVDDDNSNGPWDGTRTNPFNRIEIAIEYAEDHDIIAVCNGTYYEHLIVDKPISLQGEQQDTVIIDGGYTPYIIEIVTSYVDIKRMTLRNSGGNNNNAGIKLKADSFQISDCAFDRTRTGIFTDDSKDVRISDCLFCQNGEGIYLRNSSNFIIENSFFTHNGIGIHSALSNNLILMNCSATVNGIGIFFNDVTSAHIERCALYNNNDNQGGLFLSHCQSITVNNSYITHNGFGLKTDTCTNITIENCTFTFNTHFGMHLANQSKLLTVHNSEFITNLRISIYIEHSEITIHNSNIYGTTMGIYAVNATCKVQHNYWGSSLGPACFDRQQKEWIYTKQATVNWIPWLLTKEKPTGTTWEVDTNLPDIHLESQPIITFEEIDTDADGIPDQWESFYGYDPYRKDDHSVLDPDNDGLTNIQECYAYNWGADPFKKDVFWEMDWMESHTQPNDGNRPSETLLHDIIDVFAAHDINLHVDIGNLGGGEIIPYKAMFTYADLRDYYWDYFLHNDLNNPRKGMFHYGLICDVGPGSGFAFIGWDSLDGFCISADMLGQNLPFFTRDRFIIGGAVHELGHTLGLTVDDHGGNDNKISTILFSKQWFLYLPYRSCMNYWYTYKILSFSDGRLGPTDFNDWDHMDLSFFKNTNFTLPDQYR